jgi:hypothetical protein
VAAPWGRLAKTMRWLSGMAFVLCG